MLDGKGLHKIFDLAFYGYLVEMLFVVHNTMAWSYKLQVHERYITNDIPYSDMRMMWIGPKASLKMVISFYIIHV